MSQICSKMTNFLVQLILVVIFVTIATVKVKSKFYTLAFALINYLKETTENKLLFFYLKGGGGGAI